MRRFTCLFEELDEPTRAYLRAVRTTSARRMPGFYLGRSNPWPVIAILAGPVIALTFVFVGFASLKDAWASAMLQTAGVLLGGWMVLYAIRRFLAGSSSRVAGFYTYFDPHAAYEARGEHVTVTDVTNVTGVSAVGGQGKAAVRFEEGGQSALVPGLTPPQAVLIEDYYAAMGWITSRDEAGKNLSAATLGGAAKEYALTEQLPRDYAALNLEVEEIPKAPEKVRSAGPRVLWYGFLAGCAAAVYMLFAAIDKPIRDETAFAGAKTAPALRAYLLDDRNTAHRTEALQKLSTLYDGPVDRIRANDKADPALREGMAKLVDSLRGPEPPVVSIKVSNAEDTSNKLADFEIRNLQEQIGDGLAQAVGTDFVRFLVPEPGENPHIDVVTTVVPGQFGPKITCTVSLRLKPDGEVIAKNVVVASPPVRPEDAVAFPGDNTVQNRIRETVLIALVGQAYASVAPPPPDTDDDGG